MSDTLCYYNCRTINKTSFLFLVEKIIWYVFTKIISNELFSIILFGDYRVLSCFWKKLSIKEGGFLFIAPAGSFNPTGPYPTQTLTLIDSPNLSKNKHKQQPVKTHPLLIYQNIKEGGLNGRQAINRKLQEKIAYPHLEKRGPSDSSLYMLPVLGEMEVLVV